LPSQLFEHWVERPEVLGRFATHWKTGESLPLNSIQKIKAAKNFGQALATVEFVASAILDLEAHELENLAGFEMEKFERKVLERVGIPPSIVMRHRPAHFAHAFSGDGYSAGYYSYLWAEVLDADAFEAFEETGDVFDPETAKRLKHFIYSAGNLRSAEESYRLFRGRMPSVEPLLKKRGLLSP
jgi:peptidyl-dipeptidase Dcp